jgi:hypothetical protein
VKGLLLLLATGVSGAAVPTWGAAGQPAAAQSAQRPGWLPRWSRIDPSLTAAEKATVLARLNAIERLILQVPELARPEGFEVLPILQATPHEIRPVIQRKPDANYVVQTYQLMAFRPSKAIAGEGLVCLTVVVNPLPPQLLMDYAMNDFDDGKGDRLYIEEPFGARIPGALLAYGHRLPEQGETVSEPGTAGFTATNLGYYGAFFSADGVSPWLEVTRQEYLEARIWNDETKDLKETQRIRQSRTKTRYELWMEEAPQRKREREEALAAAEKADPAQAAAARKEAERIEREITEQLKAAEAQDRADNAEVLAQGMPGDQSRARLAALTPEERARPARIGGGTNDEFHEPPEGVRIVRANPAFYGSRNSRIAPRGIKVGFIANLTCHAPPVQRAFYAVFRKLDYAALQRLLVP